MAQTKTIETLCTKLNEAVRATEANRLLFPKTLRPEPEVLAAETAAFAALMAACDDAKMAGLELCGEDIRQGRPGRVTIVRHGEYRGARFASAARVKAEKADRAAFRAASYHESRY